MFGDDDVEQKPDLLEIFREAMGTSSISPRNTPPSTKNNSPSPCYPPGERTLSEMAMERSLINLPALLRNSLEERFIEILPDYPCFYDPNDKNFAHNQFKSNSYAEIAKKMTAEGLETSGPQLAAIFKGIKAKYREEARKMTRMEGRIEPTPFYQRLHFLERGLSTVDQNTLKRIARMRGLAQAPPLPLPAPIRNKSYTVHTGNELVIPPTPPPKVVGTGQGMKVVYGPRVTNSSTHTIITPSLQPVDHSSVQAIVEKLANTSDSEKAAIEKLVGSLMMISTVRRESVVKKLTQASNGFNIFDNGILQLLVPEGLKDEACIDETGDVVKILKTDEKYRSLTINFSDKVLGKVLIADPALTDKEYKLIEILRDEQTIYKRTLTPMDRQGREAIFKSVAEKMKPQFDVSPEWVLATFDRLQKKYTEIKVQFNKHENAVKPTFLKALSFVDRSSLADPRTSTFYQTGREEAQPITISASPTPSSESTPSPVSSPKSPVRSEKEPSEKPVEEPMEVEPKQPTPIPEKEKTPEPPKPEMVDSEAQTDKIPEPVLPEVREPTPKPEPPPENPDITAISKFFTENPDQLAMFRILASTVNQLPVERRFGHLQNLLNITNAAKEAPVHVKWNTRVYDAHSGWTRSQQSLTLAGPIPEDDYPEEPMERTTEIPLKQPRIEEKFVSPSENLNIGKKEKSSKSPQVTPTKPKLLPSQNSLDTDQSQTSTALEADEGIEAESSSCNGNGSPQTNGFGAGEKSEEAKAISAQRRSEVARKIDEIRHGRPTRSLNGSQPKPNNELKRLTVDMAEPSSRAAKRKAVENLDESKLGNHVEKEEVDTTPQIRRNDPTSTPSTEKPRAKRGRPRKHPIEPQGTV
ncbi:unnamed protein product [Bursaphelenchus xylophilus]|uniref:(pine wood nematode) hypothetical protein n=1 Tax=Bursaphelenchus xylophilus TaxID=6326 RepID=A0A1I7RJP3_BURXY|nr:unnamed protein product [Bursaphelenchus xylophilus]CAG9128975.1 unnamed protein product [Bursaphelenchus xylophilus]